MSNEAVRPADPYLAYQFTVTIAGFPKLGFSEVSGLVYESEVEPLKVGGHNDGEWSLVGPVKYPSRLILKRGLADKAYFWQWYLNVMDGLIVRRPITISINDSLGQVKRSWGFKEACPVKWTGPDLRAATAAVGFESIELIHRGSRRDHKEAVAR